MAGEARSVVVRLSMDVSDYIRNAQAAGKATEDMARRMDGTAAKQRQALDTIGSAAGKLGLVGAAAFTGIVATAAHFDKAMSAVQAATHETAGNMDLMREAAMKAGADTAFSASEAAGAIEELSKAGVSTEDILGGGLSGALNLAAAGAIEVTEASETAATALTQFGLAGDQVNHVADLLAAGAGKAQGGVDDLGMALKQSGLVASQTGLSIEETVGALSEFASAGLVGSDAGTSFKTMLQALNPNSEKAADLMASLGLSAYDAQGNFVGMANFAGQLQEALGQLSVEQQNAALKTIFGSDAVRAAAIIFKDGAQGVTEWQDKVNDAGYAAETAGLRMDNLAGDAEQLKGSLETLFIGAGEGAQGPLRKVTQGATEVVNALGAIPGPIQEVATGLAGITAVAGGGVWVGSKIVSGAHEMTEALQTLGIEAGTTKQKLATLGTATAAAALGMDAFMSSMSQLDSWQRSRDAADATVESFQDLSDALQYSNVGKYADDLHINLGRLTQDLYDNGTSGEYTKRVLDELAGSSQGFGALLNAEASHIIPFWSGSAEKAYDARKDLNAIIEKGTGLVGASSDAMAEAAGATADYGTRARTVAQAVAELNSDIRKQREAARGTAQEFVGLADSLDDSKVSLGEWIHDLEKQAKALQHFRENAEEAADKGLRKGLITALEEAGPAGALRMKQLANATDAEIKRANKAWQSGQREIGKYTDAIGGVPTEVSTDVEVNTFDAMRAVAKLQNALAQVKSKDIDVRVHYMNFGNKLAGMAADGLAGADGMTVPGQRHPYGDKTLIWAAPGEEVITNRNGEADQFRADRAAGRIPAYADGGAIPGYAGGGEVRSLDDRLAIAQTLQEIRDLKRDLARDGKQRLTGIDRRIAQLELERAERELRLVKTREEREARQEAREKLRERRQDLRDQRDAIRQAGAGLSFDSLVPGQPQTVAQGVAAEIQDFWQQIFEAGGTIDTAMLSWAADMVAAAEAYDETVAALEVEQGKRDALSQSLAEQQSQLDALNSTMESFAASVAGNFTSSPFTRSSVERKSPQATALEQQLAAAQAAGDAAGASRLMQQIALAQADSATGLEALRASVEGDIADAEAFTAALEELASKGLDTTGPLGALYMQLAASGDVVTAQDLADLSAEQIDQYEKLFATREDRAATAGALATQAVYGEQHAVLVSAVTDQTAALRALDATITVLEATQAVLGEQVRAGAEAGALALERDDGKLEAIRKEVSNLPRELQRVIRKEN